MEMTALLLKHIALLAGGEGSALSGEVEPTCLQPSLAMGGDGGMAKKQVFPSRPLAISPGPLALPMRPRRTQLTPTF